MAKPNKTDVVAATALGNACDRAVKRFLKFDPKNAKALQRAVATIYMSGVQQAASTVIAGSQLGDAGAGAAALEIAQQLDRAVAMVAEAMGFTKQSGREDPGADRSRLILPGDHFNN